MSPADRRSDEELVAVCNVGDAYEAARAFEALYRRHRDFVLRVARRFTRDRELALDALQETFTYLLNKFPPAGEGLTLSARLQTLLYPAAKNAAITAVRKARRAAGAGDAALDVPLGTVKSRLHLAMKELREDSRLKDLFDP